MDTIERSNEERRETASHVEQAVVNSEQGVVVCGSGTLCGYHREHLKASGLTDATVQTLGFVTVNMADARAILLWPQEKRGDPAGLLIRYPGMGSYAKVRPDVPRTVHGRERRIRAFTDHNYAAQEPDPDSPKAIKYEAPIGSDPHCYIPLPICSSLADPEMRLYITEGEKKAALMCQEGQPCISIPSVNSGHDVEHRRDAQDWGGEEFVIHPELTPYMLPGREVCIVFDSPDMEQNLDVIRGAVRLAKMVEATGAMPLIGYVPVVNSSTKTGIDDYFVFVQNQRKVLGSQLTTSPLATDFVDARPVGPNRLLAWLVEQKAECAWTKDELRQELRRAAIWVRVWHECEQKAFNSWCKAAKNEFFVKLEEFKSMVEHLHVSTSRTKKGKGGYDAFDDADLSEHCVPVLNTSFALLRNADGTERVFSVNSRREVTYVLTDTHLLQALHDALKEKFQAIPPERLLTRAVALWKRESPRLAVEPEPFSFQGDALTFKRFDWTPSPGVFTAWEEFLSRLSDRDAFMAFVWSCFEPQNVSRQYLWLRGNGQDGKSRVLSTILDVFGPAATGITGSQFRETRFLNSAIYGKRVVVYADCKSPRFGMTEFVRNCTSGDPVMVEFKGGTAFSWQMRMKLLVASNPKPEFTGQAADASRMIYVEVGESRSKDDPTWGSRLATELSAFLHACRMVYERICPHHGDIAVSDRSRELRAEAAAAFEERWYDLFNGNFESKPGMRTAADKVSRRLRSIGLSNNEMGDFKAWMDRVHGVRFKRTSSERYYENLLVIDPLEEVLRK